MSKKENYFFIPFWNIGKTTDAFIDQMNFLMITDLFYCGGKKRKSRYNGEAPNKVCVTNFIILHHCFFLT